MNIGPENIDDLLGKYFSGEASEQEVTLVKNWLSVNESNRKYYEQVKTIFDKVSHVKEWQEFDTDKAWTRLRSNLKKESTPVIPLNRKPPSTNWYWRVAAAIAFVIAAGVYFYKTSSTEVSPSLELVAEKQAVSDTLPGGSNVFLNKQSKVVYTYDQKTKTHEVKLKGEAYFSIQHGPREQFIIDAEGVFIKDIGTSFNVRAYPGSDEVEVLVEEGEVVFFTENNPGIHLKESGKGVYNKVTKTFRIEEPDANITAYKTKFFVFSTTDLQTIAETLNGVYESKIEVPEHLRKCEVTVTFRDETIEEIVAVISETLNLTTKSEQGKIIFEGEGCE